MIDPAVSDVVLCIISDDYESFEHVSHRTQKAFCSKNLSVSNEEIIEALKVLIGEGLAYAFVLSPQAPHTVPTPFCLNSITELWFYITPEGKAVVKNWAKLGLE